MRRIALFLSTIAASLIFASCGGGGPAVPASTTQVAPTAAPDRATLIAPNRTLAPPGTPQIAYFPIPNGDDTFNAWLAVGADGALWFTQPAGVGRMTTSGVFTTYQMPGQFTTGIAAGPDGALWIGTLSTSGLGLSGVIGRITTGGTLTTYALPPGESVINGIAAGPDGAMWFPMYPAHPAAIGRIDMSGNLTYFAVPGMRGTHGTYPSVTSITLGPDGAMWFTVEPANKVGRITTSGTVFIRAYGPFFTF